MKSVLGTMTFSDQVDTDSSRIMLEKHQASGNPEIDTAHQYNKGQTELLLGDLISPGQRSSFFIASKVHPWNDDGLKPAQVTHQIETSPPRFFANLPELPHPQPNFLPPRHFYAPFFPHFEPEPLKFALPGAIRTPSVGKS